MPHICDLVKAGVIAKAEDGWSMRQIALRYNINKNSVFNILKKWRINGTISRNPGSGRRRISTQQQDLQLVNTLVENPFYSVIQAAEDTNFPGSSSTGRRRVRESELRCHPAAQKYLLKAVHKEARLGFALEYLVHDVDFWNNVVFTDEKTFQSTHSGRIRVYRPPNTRYDEKYISNNDKSGRFSVNMWAWISARGPGVLWHIEERFNSETYIRILDNIMLPSVSQLFPNNEFIFQQDNCSVHTAHTVTNWFQDNNINVLNWPSHSPDLNPVEDVWGLLVRSIQKRNVRPRNAQELLEIINDAWENIITNDYCIRLFNSMPNRLIEVINRNGAITKY